MSIWILLILIETSGGVAVSYQVDGFDSKANCAQAGSIATKELKFILSAANGPVSKGELRDEAGDGIR